MGRALSWSLLLSLVSLGGCDRAPSASSPASAPPAGVDAPAAPGADPPRSSGPVEPEEEPRPVRGGRAQALPANHVTGLAVSPDGSRALCADAYGLRLWDARAWKEVALLPVPEPALHHFGVLPGGSRFFVAHYGDFPGGGSVVVRQLEDGAELGRWSVSGFAAGPFAAVAGDRLFGAHGAGSSYELGLWATQTGAGHRVVGTVPAAVTGAAASPSGARAASLSRDGLARVWDTESGAEVLQLPAPGGGQVVFLGEDRLVTSVFQGLTVVWDLATKESVRTADGGYCVAVSADASRLAVGGLGDLQIIDLAGGARTVERAHSGEVASVAFLPDGTLLSVGGMDCTLAQWDAGEGRQLRKHAFPTAEPRSSSAPAPPGGD